jgi:anti-sigma factor RsiW
MPISRQPALSADVPIVDRSGAPTPEFQRAWQGLAGEAATGGAAPNTYVRKGLMSGWASATGTADRTAFTTYSAPTISNPPTQAEVQAIANHVQVLSRHMKAMIDDLKTLQAFVP